MSTQEQSHTHVEGHEEWAVHAHISDWKFLVGIFAALIVLTVITVAVSRVDLGSANTVVAVLIATMKASLVATFFMHLRHDKLFNSVIFVSAFIFLGIFFIYTVDDLSTRGRIDPANGVSVYARNGEKAPGGFTPVELPEHTGGAHGAATGTHNAAAPTGAEPAEHAPAH